MNEFKGTPGPWRTAIRRGYVAVMAGPQNETKGVADCRTVDTEYAEAVANCTLVAAAPDLLAALAGLVGRLERENGWVQTEDGLSAARAAIHKALHG